MTESRQLGTTVVGWVPYQVVSCNGANLPTIWVALCMGGFCAMYGVSISPWDHSLREVERAERPNAIDGASKPIALRGDGADGSAEGRWRLYHHFFLGVKNNQIALVS